MNATFQQIKTIHAEARRVGMDDETRRLFMVRETGKDSTKSMTGAEAQKVILALKKLAGTSPVTRTRCQIVSGKYAGILRAMWLNAYHLGVVRNRDDKALIAFARRQTGLSHTQFLTDGHEAGKVIDGLKKMMEREAGLDLTEKKRSFSQNPAMRTEFYQRRVLAAQRRILGIVEAPHIGGNQLNTEIARLGPFVREKMKMVA